MRDAHADEAGVHLGGSQMPTATAEFFVVCQGDRVVGGPLSTDKPEPKIRKLRLTCEWGREQYEKSPGVHSERLTLRTHGEFV